MNSSLVTALKRLKASDIEALRSDLGILLGGKGVHETATQYVTRFLRKVESDGKIRELEQEMLRFK